MNNYQQLFLVAWGMFSILLFLKGFYESYKKHNAFGTAHTFLFGAYVWGDAAVLGIFWALVSMATLLLQDWILFWLTLSLFWVVRSFGETIYWLNEQHASKKRVKLKEKMLSRYFNDDAALFVYQLTQQCITVVSLVASIYFASLWTR